MPTPERQRPIGAASGRPVDPDDPFDTAGLRAAVLDIWRRSPARLREDANAEESLALVGYAGRVLVELIANAADAAVAAGEPARIRITTTGDELRIANTGAPLTAAGVASLATLRASAKTADDAGVGRFGVGFTAVLAVSDRPSVVSTNGAVRFDAAATAATLAGLAEPALDTVVADRGGHVPVLRLPWPAHGRPPAGFTTEVRLPLRPGVDAAELLAEIGDHLLLALPAVERLEVDGRVLSRLPSDDDTVLLSDTAAPVPVTRWRLATRSGVWESSQLVGLPTEQRRSRWRLTWAYPTTRPLGPDVLYAPTPTDEPLGLPARLIGTFPVDDTRRHLASGPLVDALVDEAVAAYLDLMASTDPADRLTLLPAVELGRGELDHRLRQRITDAVRAAPLLVSAAGEAVRPTRAVLLPGVGDELIALAAEAVPGLLPAPRDAARREALRALGVRTLTIAELSSAFGSLGREPAFWGRVYAALDETGAAAEDLADLPMVLAGGRTVLGARGCLVADPGQVPWLTAATDAVPGLRLVHPEATFAPGARRLLLRIGAVDADATAVLADPAVRRVVEELRADLDDADVAVERVEAVGTAVLDLVAAGGVPVPELVADLLLTTADDEPWPAAELTLPGSPLRELLTDADLEEVGGRWTSRYADDVLRRAGVLFGFRVVEDPAPTGPDHDLPDEDRWWDEVLEDGPPPSTFVAVADLDLVADNRWPEALELLTADRAARDALAPVGDRPSYTSWWLRRFAVIAGRPPTAWRLPGATELAGLYDVLPEPIPASTATAIGVRAGLAEVLADAAVDLLHRLGDPDREVPAARVPALTTALVAALPAGGVDPLPRGVRALSGAVSDADDAVVLDLPWYAAVLDPARTVPGGADPAAVATLLDLETASERYPAVLVSSATSRGGPPAATLTDAVDALGLDSGLVADVRVDPELTVRIDGVAHRVSWWVSGDQRRVDGSAAGWGRMLAWSAGDWSLRHTATAWVVGDRAAVVEDGLVPVADAPTATLSDVPRRPEER